MSTQVETVAEVAVEQEQDVAGAMVAPVVDRGLVAQLWVTRSARVCRSMVRVACWPS